MLLNCEMFGQVLVFTTVLLLILSRPNISQYWRPKICRTTFLNYVRFASSKISKCSVRFSSICVNEGNEKVAVSESCLFFKIVLSSTQWHGVHAQSDETNASLTDCTKCVHASQGFHHLLWFPPAPFKSSSGRFLPKKTCMVAFSSSYDACKIYL